MLTSGWRHLLLPTALALAPLVARADDGAPQAGTRARDLLGKADASALERIAAQDLYETAYQTLALTRQNYLVELVASDDDLLGLTLAPADEAIRGQLGLPEGQGLVVASVASGGAAERVGLKPSDILLTLGDRPLGEPGDLSEGLKAAGEEAVALKLLRGGKAETLRVKPQSLVTFAPAEPETPEWFIGVSVNPVDATLRSHLPDLPEGRGVVVNEVIGGSPAEAAGVRVGDILLSFADTPLDSLETLAAQVQARGDQATSLALLRGGKPVSLQVTPERRPRSEATGSAEAQAAEKALRAWTGFAPQPDMATWRWVAVPQAVDLNTGLASPGYAVGSPHMAIPAQTWSIVQDPDHLIWSDAQQKSILEVLARMQSGGPAPVEARLKELSDKVEELSRLVEELKAARKE
jgi:hypothetical protein